jgi:sugar lactone lactonase YvrE
VEAAAPPTAPPIHAAADTATGVPSLGEALRDACAREPGIAELGFPCASPPAFKLQLGAALSPISSAKWTPPKAPKLEGPYAPNEALEAADRLAEGAFTGPEDLAVDAFGRIYAGIADGRVVRLDGDRLETFAATGGRPLGMVFAPDGRLLVAVADVGLVAITPAGLVSVLADSYAGAPIQFADGIDVTADGIVYFTDASSRFPIEDFVLDFLDARPYGSLYRYDLATGELSRLLTDLYFPNGVALAADGRSLVFPETPRYRVRRLWLVGARAGQLETLIDNLPGFPDGISRTTDGGFWVALVNPRNALIDFAHPRPWLKNLIAALPDWLRPAPERHGFALRLSASGKAVDSLQDSGGDVISGVTSVRDTGDALLFGSLDEPYIGRLPR